MALIGNLTVSFTATTTDFDGKMAKTRQTLRLTQDQVAEVAKGFGSLGTALTQAGAQASTSATGFDRAATSLKNIKKASDEAGSGLGAVSGGIKALGTSLGGLAIAVVSFQALKGAAEGLLDSATKSQSLTAAFTAIAGSAQAGAEQLGFVRATADKLGFSFTALAGAYKGLSAATRGTNLEGAATRDIFTAVATASRTLQLSSDDTKGILLALQQVISKGTVQAEELRGQIGERLPGAFGIAARAMGVTEKELTKLLETGSVASKDFIPRFARQLQKDFAGGAEDAAKTFAAATARLENAFQRLGEAVAASGILDKLGTIIDRLAKIIERGPKAADALRGVVRAQTQKDEETLKATGYPQVAAGQRFLNEINTDIAKQEELIAKAEVRLKKFAGGNAANEATQRKYVLAPLQEELARLQADKVTLLKAIGDAAAQLAGQDEGFGTISNRYDRTQNLKKSIAEQLAETNKAVQLIDQEILLAPANAVELTEEKIKLLDKAIKALQTTLAQNKDVTSLLQGPGSLNTKALQNATPENTTRALALIQSEAPKYGVDPALAAAIAYQESHFNPNAKGPTNDVGLMQLTPPIIKAFGVTDPFDIQQNLTGGLKLIRELMQTFPGEIDKQISAYQAGPSAVKNRGALAASSLSSRYVPSVLETYTALKAGGPAGTGPLSTVPELDDLLQRKKGLEAYQEAQKAIKKNTEDEAKAAVDASERIVQARLNVTAHALKAVDELQKLNEKYAFTPEESDRTKAARLVALTQSEETIHALALEQQANIEVGIALQEKAVALQKVADVSKVAYDAGRTYIQQLEQDLLRLQGVPREDRRVAPGDLAPEYQAQAAELKKQIAAQQTLNELTKASDAFAESFLSNIEQVTSGGIKSFRAFADSVLRDIQRIINQQVVQPVLSELIKKGLEAVVGTGKGGGGGGGGASGIGAAIGGLIGSLFGGGDFGSTGPSDSGGGGAFASGGPVTAGRSYFVGEKGPEPFIPSVNGHIMSHEEALGVLSRSGKQGAAQGQTPITVTFNVQATDAPSFAKSRGELQRLLIQTLQQAQRAA